jgi:hypothetical protein
MAAQRVIDHLENLLPVHGGGSLWALLTTRPLASVTEAYLNSEVFTDRRLMRHDRIMVTAGMNEPKAVYATGVVTAVDELGRVAKLMLESSL